MSLDAVMGHLAPGDEAMAAAAKDAAATLAKEIRSIGVISLSATAAEPVGCLPAASRVLVFKETGHMAAILLWDNTAAWTSRVTPSWC